MRSVLELLSSPLLHTAPTPPVKKKNSRRDGVGIVLEIATAFAQRKVSKAKGCQNISDTGKGLYIYIYIYIYISLKERIDSEYKGYQTHIRHRGFLCLT